MTWPEDKPVLGNNQRPLEHVSRRLPLCESHFSLKIKQKRINPLYSLNSEEEEIFLFSLSGPLGSAYSAVSALNAEASLSVRVHRPMQVFRDGNVFCAEVEG